MEAKEYVTVVGDVNPNWKARALKAEAKLEAAELVVMIANDIINMWPTVTFRTIVRVTEKLAFLKDAVKEYSVK